MTVVGPVTERWAPEQAGPVHENWQLAAPIGPATDLWALGALLFRAVQGHAPYPEENTGELVQMVCAEPPAFAEECGPLRPVVESLLRQDPTERLDFEELRGWLRSLVRSAPEPEAGANVVVAPPFDATRLPIVRRRGELVRRRRWRSSDQAGAGPGHARHKRAKAQPQQAERRTRPERRPQPERGPRKARSLGRTLLVLVLLGLAAAVAYAVLFMPKAEPSGGTPGDGGKDHAGATGGAGPRPRAAGPRRRRRRANPRARTAATTRRPPPPPIRRPTRPSPRSRRASHCARTPKGSASPSPRAGTGRAGTDRARSSTHTATSNSSSSRAATARPRTAATR